MSNVQDYFGCDVFDDRKMKTCLSSDVYDSLRQTMEEGKKLDIDVANSVAEAMKEWAVSKGATHFTHWFQPLTGITAEKHDSFIERSPLGGVILDFSGKELVKGEPDASSLPSGGLRATFEARGYTAWDPTSYAFIKGKTLYIPTAFCSYTGEALDKKTPLLRSMDALNREALRVLKAIGEKEVKHVTAVAGAEQEYFLVPLDLFEKRDDLKYAGRTLFGAAPPKGQELDDHYFGAIKPGVEAFMTDLNETLWKLGVPAKTEHNEVAPSQHELACIYTTVNMATDQNQLVMEILKKTAANHHFACLLHEKPFKGVNGSGKHDNWSLATDTGTNLLAPGKTPAENIRFLLFISAVIRAVDDYQDLLRLSVATASNDHRLGANEAPPAVISIFLGEDLTSLLESFAEGKTHEETREQWMKLGSAVLPEFHKDQTDRNRTSPFAYTGNKFEFRMPGASDSIACPNIMLNSAVSESLRCFADVLEKAEDKESAVREIIADTYRDHCRIIFNGNGYDDSWIEEAESRGLLNYRSTPECMPHLMDRKNVEMLTRAGVYDSTELQSRCDIMLENYCKTVVIEARTMVDMAYRLLAPSAEKYAADLASRAVLKRSAVSSAPCMFEEHLVRMLSAVTDEIYMAVLDLEKKLASADCGTWAERSVFLKDEVIPAMETLRKHCDEAERITAKEYWPVPSYGELLFGTK
ncbi:MAG: glutamine synthetase III [Oscillospiraceae bacterium]|nr:glutamine synthetase III [Oscillospiraceae bacterium]